LLFGFLLHSRRLRFFDLRQGLARGQRLSPRLHDGNGHEALPHGDAALQQKAADLIGYTRALSDKARAHTVQCEQMVSPLLQRETLCHQLAVAIP
jgi:hypothetical protein